VYVKAVVTTSAEDRRVSGAKTLELFDCEAGLADDAAQGTDGDLLVARDDHDDGCLSGSRDELHVAAFAADRREPGCK
jgi:hypothetical protein